MRPPLRVQKPMQLCQDQSPAAVTRIVIDQITIPYRCLTIKTKLGPSYLSPQQALD
jgi:hypothetical protein